MAKKNNDRKSFLVIGMGSFGKKLAFKLQELDNDVMVVDKIQSRIDEMGEFFDDAYCADLSKELVCQRLGVEKFDACFVAIGDDFRSSLEVAAVLKDCGAKYIVAKTTNEIQSNLLKKIGVDELVFPEYEIAEKLAIMKNAGNVEDYIALDSTYALYSVVVPSSWIGKTIVDLDVRKKCSINVVAIQNSDNALILKIATHIFEDGDRIKILGRQDEIEMVSETLKNF